MTRTTLTAFACGTALLFASATASFAQQAGTGSTGNPTNNPAKLQADMMKHKTKAKLPNCTATVKTHCHHHKTM
jgi:hypothetical protein